MIDADYYKTKGLVEQIDRKTKAADEFKKILEGVKEHGANSKLFVYVKGESSEITLSNEALEVALRECIRELSNSVKELKEEIDKILDDYLAGYLDDNDKEG